MIVLETLPASAPREADRRECLDDEVALDDHARADVVTIEETRTSRRKDSSVLDVGVLQRVDVNRLAPRVDREVPAAGDRPAVER